MKIYTKAGDKGETGLLGVWGVRKNALRVEASGAVDELNAFLGFSGAALADPEATALLLEIQRDLLAVGTQLANVRGDRSLDAGKTAFPPQKVEKLERAIDRLEEQLVPVKAFILQGGSEAGARLHVARTVCRRAERRIAALAEKEAVSPVILAYLNRLSDLLFVLARWANRRAGHEEAAW